MSSTIHFRFQCPLAGQQFLYYLRIDFSTQLQFSFLENFLVMQFQFRIFPNYLFMQLQFFFAGTNSAEVFCGRVLGSTVGTCSASVELLHETTRIPKAK